MPTRKRRTDHEPTTLLPALVLFALVTVEFGGWSLLGLLTQRDALTPFEEQFFRAGGFFLHMLVGGEGSSSAGTLVTRIGAVLLAAALVTLGVGLLRAGRTAVRST